MPIVINEIEISVSVSPDSNQQNSTVGSSGENASREAIIKECVEKIMEIINLKNER